MHIPDGFLSAKAWVSTWVISIAVFRYCLKKTADTLKERMVPLLGVMSAFIFAAQMINFPVMAGTSGHLLGGVLAGILLGPYVAAICLSCVLIVQCLIFQDGGLTALGANILNMAMVGALGGYFVYWLLKFIFVGKRGMLLAAAIAAWFSVVAAASLCAVELAVSGTSPLNIVFPAMVWVHAFIGLGEAIITVLVLGFVLKVRPDLIYSSSKG